MTGLVIIALVIVALAAAAAAYVYGYFNGSASAQHPDGPETCRAKLRAAERTAETYKSRVRQLEGQLQQLEHNVTASTTILLEEMDRELRAAGGGYSTAAAGSGN